MTYTTNLDTNKLVFTYNNDISAQCKLIRKPHTTLPDNPVKLTSMPKYFQMLSDSSGAK